jgi:hypothetical protein
VEEVFLEAQQEGHYDIAIQIAKEITIFNKSHEQLIHPPQDKQHAGYLELLQVLKEHINRIK